MASNSLNDLLIRIDATTELLRREMKKAEDITDGSTRKMDRSLEKIDKRMVALAKRAAAWGAAMVSAFAVAGGVKLVQIARETDILDAQLKTATGSAEGAAKAFAELERFAAETPFALQELVTSFVQLKVRGLDPSLRSLAAYGNIASAMGANIEEMVLAVSNATTGEFDGLKRFGIKAKKDGDEISFIFKGITTTVGNNLQQIERYFRELAETNFPDAMRDRVNSLDGALSNLADSWDALFRTIARGPIGDLIEEYVRQATAAIERLDRMLAELMGSATPLEMLQNQLDELFLRRQRLERQLATPNPMGRAFFGQLSEELDAVKAQIEVTQEALRHFKSEAENSAANAPREAPQIFPTVTVLKKKKKKDEPFDPSETLLSRESDRIQQAVAEVDRFFEATMTETEQLERQIARVQELASQGFFALRGVDDEEILRRLNEQLEAVQSKTEEGSSQIAEVLANNVGGAIDEMFASGELSAQRFFEAMLRDIARIAVQLYIMKPLIEGLFGAGGGAGKFGQGLFKAFGFARGADFTVGGSGGQDSQFMPMMLSPGERVKITPAGKSSGDVSVTVIDQRGAGAPPVDVSEQLVGMQRQIQVLVRGEVAGMYRDGSIDKLNGAVGFPVRRRGSR